MTADQVRNPPRDHKAFVPRQILAVTRSFLRPTHHDVNLIAPLRNSQFEPLINVETQVSPNCVLMILTVRQQRSEFYYLQDDRNVFGYRPKVALSKTNLMTSVVNWQRVIRRRLRTPPSLINLSKPSSYLPYHQF